MILRDIAECDYHYTAEQVGKWTMYQFRQYICEKAMLSTRKSFSTLEEAREYAAEVKQARKTLRGFSFASE